MRGKEKLKRPNFSLRREQRRVEGRVFTIKGLSKFPRLKKFT